MVLLCIATTKRQGLVGNAINAFSEDSDDNLWFGSDTGGALETLTRNGFAGYFRKMVRPFLDRLHL